MTRYPWLWELSMWLRQAGINPSMCTVTLEFSRSADEARAIMSFKADQIADWRKVGNNVITTEAFPSTGQLNGLHYKIGSGE